MYLAAVPRTGYPHLVELIIGTIAFLIVFAVLYRVLMPRIQQTLTERTDQIEGGLQRAERGAAGSERRRWSSTRRSSPRPGTKHPGCARRPRRRAPDPRGAARAG